ncbi:MAG: O-antigen ligase family protein [Coriobacteriia bacterium]|nr:O-antigen ligase family protein [Coriobacteriia bacterium]
MAKRKKTTAGAKAAAAAVRPIAEDWSIARHIAWWSILAMVFLTPVAISNLSFLGVALPLSYDQFDIIKVFIQRVLGLTALAAWSWDILVRGGKVRHTPVEWLMLAFFAWVAIGAVFSIHPPTAIFGKYRRFEGLLSFINYGVAYWITLQLTDKAARIKQLAQSVFWAGLVVGGYGLMQAFGQDILKWGTLPFEVNRSFSTYGNPDLLGGFLMFGTFVSLGLALAESNLVWRGVYWFGFLINSAVIVTAFTRSAWVGAIPGFIFIALFAFRQKIEWKTEDWVFSGTALAASLAFIVRSLSADNEIMNFAKRFQSIFVFDQGSAKTRFQIWQAAIDAIKDRPIFGFGADTFRLVFPQYKPVEYVKDAGYLSVADNVHNYPLQLATGVGVPGVALLYGVFGWAAVRSWKTVWARDTGVNKMILAGFWAACAAYVTHLFFGLSVTGSSFLLWVSMAAVLSPTAKVIQVRPLGTWGIVAAGVVTMLALFGIGYQFVFMQADKAYLMARIGTQGAERTQYAEQAVRLNPWNDMYRAEVGLALTDEAIAAINAAGTDPAGQEAARATALQAFTRAEKALLDTIAFVPPEYDNYVFLANLYNMGGQFFDPAYYDKAIAIALKGVEVEEFGPAVRFQLARAYLSTDQQDKAIEQLEINVAMDPAYVESVTALAQIYEMRGDLKNAIRVLRVAEDYRPGQAGVADKLAQIEASSTATTSAP